VFDFFVPKVRGKRVQFQTVSVGEENEIKKISQKKGFENSYNFGVGDMGFACNHHMTTTM
jgi:hypothetical protein